VQSNCLSVEPLETEFGRKRTINQSTCNKDRSCLKGFCPSFITVEGGQLRKPTRSAAALPDAVSALPEPVQASLAQPYGLVVAGVGGTGVITIGQLLGMAAHIDGKGIVTQDAAGLAQKGGATWSHVLLAQDQAQIRTTRVSMAAAHLVIGCDPIVTASRETTLRMREGFTHVALNAYSTPTAAFVQNTEWQNPADQCVAEIARTVGEAQLSAFNADALARQMLGDTIYVNPMILGYAWQKGWIPLSREALRRAIELNNVAVANNLAAFEWGRYAAHDPAAVGKLLAPVQTISFVKREPLETLVQKRADFLTHYQNAAYARDYTDFVDKVRQAEASLGKTALTEAVARGLFKLMAYKDEYEVARLHADPAFLSRIEGMFEGDYKVRYHLAPPLLASRNDKGELVKRSYGSMMLWGFRVLRHLKFLRGTALDLFGRTEERRTERALIQEYKSAIDTVLAGLKADNHAQALEMARIPEKIKGYGHVKERNLRAVRQQWSDLMARWQA